MYKNIIFFSFHFITQNIRMGWVRERETEMAEMHPHTNAHKEGRWCGSSVKPLTFYFVRHGSKFPPVYIIFGRAHKLTWSYLSPTCCLWTHHFLACHPWNLRGIFAGVQTAFCLLLETGALPIMPPLCGISAGEQPESCLL